VAILRKRAALDRVRVQDPAVLELVADRVTDNIRSLEGALIRIVAHHSLTGRPVDLDLAREVLDDIHPVAAQTGGVSLQRIQETVAGHFGITAVELASGTREARIAWPRQLAIHMCRELTDVPLQTIGQVFGGRNHATVLHACKRVRERVLTSPEDAAELDTIRGLLA
jgi:chromosomal replication initiator protein